MKNTVFFARRQIGWTQKELAKALKISCTTMSLIERNKSAPSVYLALRIASVLEVDINQIFKLE
jgi:putative transcriptional regulator